MQDRGYVKWAPFNSVINDKLIKREMLKKQEKIDKPVLSEDQIEFLNNKIFEVYTNHIKIKLTIFKDNKIINLIGYINKIDINKKYIIFNKSIIFFNQIINVTTFFEKV